MEEKPQQPRSPYAITGLYFVDAQASDIASTVKPSRRAETEIVDVLKAYHERGQLRAEVFGRGTTWLDTGTPESLQEASTYIEAIEKRQGLKVACPEEVAYRAGFIDGAQIARLAHDYGSSSHGEYLRELLTEI